MQQTNFYINQRTQVKYVIKLLYNKKIFICHANYRYLQEFLFYICQKIPQHNPVYMNKTRQIACSLIQKQVLFQLKFNRTVIASHDLLMYHTVFYHRHKTLINTKIIKTPSYISFTPPRSV